MCGMSLGSGCPLGGRQCSPYCKHLTGLAGRDIYFQLIFPSVSLSELPKLYPIITNGIFITCNTLDFSDHDPGYDKLMIRINGSNGFKISTNFLR